MKIEDNRKDHNVCISDIEIGECFMIHENLYLKINDDNFISTPLKTSKCKIVIE